MPNHSVTSTKGTPEHRGKRRQKSDLETAAEQRREARDRLTRHHGQ